MHIYFFVLLVEIGGIWTFEKQLILGLGQGIYKMSLGQHIVPEGKEVLKNNKRHTKKGICQRDTGGN